MLYAIKIYPEEFIFLYSHEMEDIPFHVQHNYKEFYNIIHDIMYSFLQYTKDAYALVVNEENAALLVLHGFNIVPFSETKQTCII